MRSGVAAVALGLALVTTGCTMEANPVVRQVAQNPVTPIVLEIVKGGLVKLATSAGAQNPPVAAIALAGVWGVSELEKKVAEIRKEAGAAEPDTTLLLINQTIDGTVRTSVFKISTGRKLSVALNGRFVQEIEPRRISITAEPGTDSTIVVSDAKAGEAVFISRTLAMGSGDRSYADLETGRDNKVKRDDRSADLRVDGGGGLTTVNGAWAAKWTSTDTPSLAGCGSLPEASWTTVLYPEEPPVEVYKDVWCLRSGDGRYGTFAWGGGIAGWPDQWKLAYVLWKKADDK
ncbi:hypothetical protein ACIRBX_05160 [Kitasatospora sp. NPDC096147]|uniref:hypothetical protein n=1 Tax=Kitasatospora sp. NPDC096147 TaxID=3364093 RepID=UPI0038071B39